MPPSNEDNNAAILNAEKKTATQTMKAQYLSMAEERATRAGRSFDKSKEEKALSDVLTIEGIKASKGYGGIVAESLRIQAENQMMREILKNALEKVNKSREKPSLYMTSVDHNDITVPSLPQTPKTIDGHISLS